VAWYRAAYGSQGTAYVTAGGMRTAANSRDHHMTDHDMAPMLLRFYQQTEGPQHRDLRNTCLDAWDNLLKTSGFHGSSTQLNLIDTV
jgi:hypothetical protein